MKKCLLMIVAIFAFAATAMAQKGTVTATIVDAETGETIIGAVITATPEANPEKPTHTTSGYEGAVTLKSLPYGNYALSVQFMGYTTHEQQFTLDKSKLDLGKISLKEGVQIERVVKEAKAIRASQKGDTLSYSAGAFKVANDSDVEGLLKKMPGITVSDGKVETQGEEV